MKRLLTLCLAATALTSLALPRFPMYGTGSGPEPALLQQSAAPAPFHAPMRVAELPQTPMFYAFPARGVMSQTWGTEMLYEFYTTSAPSMAQRALGSGMLNNYAGEAPAGPGRLLAINTTSMYGQLVMHRLTMYNTPWMETLWTIDYDITAPDFKPFSIMTGGYDTASDMVYAVINLDGSYAWASIAPRTGALNVIKSLEQPWNAVAADASGNFYGIDHDGNFFSIDAATGTTVAVRSTGIVGDAVTGAFVDAAGSFIYYCYRDLFPGTSLYAIDLGSGDARKLWSTGIVDMDIPLRAIHVPGDWGTAPGRCATPVYTDKSSASAGLNGTIAFTAPTWAMDNETSLEQKELAWNIYAGANTIPIATGTCVAGEEVSAAVTFESAGSHRMFVTFTCEGETSPATAFAAEVKSPNVSRNTSTSAYRFFNDGDDLVVEWQNGSGDNPNRENSKEAWFGRYTVVIHSGATSTAATSTPAHEAVVSNECIKEAADYSSSVWYQYRWTPEDVTTTTYYAAAVGVEGGSAGAFIANHPYLPAPEGNLWRLHYEDEITFIPASDDGNPTFAHDPAWEYAPTSIKDPDILPNFRAKNQKTAYEHHYYVLNKSIELEAGKWYHYAMKAVNGVANAPHDVKVKLFGENAAASDVEGEALYTILTDNVPASSIPTLATVPVIEAYFQVPATQKYSLVLEESHANGVSGTNGLRFSAVRLSEVTAPDGPKGTVTNATATLDADNPLKVTLAFTLPATSLKGDNLLGASDADKQLKVKIERDGTTLYDAAATAATMTWTDDTATRGAHTYAITAYNAAGSTPAAEVSVFAGLDYPVYVAAHIEEDATAPGTVKIAWDAAVTDVRNTPYPAAEQAKVTYNLYRMDNEVEGEYRIAEGLTACAYTDIFLTEGQSTVMYAVESLYNGEANPVKQWSLPIWVGAPVALPYTEQFNINAMSGFTTISASTGTELFYANGYAGIEVPVQHGGEGDAYFAATFVQSGATAMFTFPKMQMPDNGANTVLSLQYLELSAYDTNGNPVEITNTVEVQIVDDGTSLPNNDNWGVHRYVTNGSQVGWKKVFINLSDYAGKVIQPIVRLTSGNFNLVAIDELKVYTMPAADLGVMSLKAPAAAVAGQPATFLLNLENNGSRTASGYSVELLRDGTAVATATPAAIASGRTSAVTLADNTLAIGEADARHTYTATVTLADDADTQNNTSLPVTVKVDAPDYETVNDLTAARDEEGNITVAWSQPDLTAIPRVTVLDDMEAYGDYTTEGIGEWTTIDVDGKRTYLTGANIQGISDVDGIAFFVMNGDTPGFTLEAASGERFLMNASADGAQANDWLITPELSGEEQTITFMARSAQAGIFEGLEIYTSVTVPTVDAMEPQGIIWTLPDSWVRISVPVPAGTKYVGLNYNQQLFNLHVGVCLDDFVMRTANAPYAYELIGYELYCDDALLATLPVDTTSYTYNPGDKLAHTYYVHPVYTPGHAVASNEASVEEEKELGIDTLDADSTPVRIYNVQGQRVDKPVRGTVAIVVNADGTVSKTIVK